jgi:hypothetical protein
MKYQKHTFENSTEEIDGNEYEECEFRNCRIVFRGGALPIMSHCHFIHPQFFMKDAAERTMLLLKGMYHSGDSMRHIVERSIEKLVSPSHEQRSHIPPKVKVHPQTPRLTDEGKSLA